MHQRHNHPSNQPTTNPKPAKQTTLNNNESNAPNIRAAGHAKDRERMPVRCGLHRNGNVRPGHVPQSVRNGPGVRTNGRLSAGQTPADVLVPARPRGRANRRVCAAVM